MGIWPPVKVNSLKPNDLQLLLHVLKSTVGLGETSPIDTVASGHLSHLSHRSPIEEPEPSTEQRDPFSPSSSPSTPS